jgi:Na+-translocating ferredoxin:NAD+ oxidoreductase RNF subunit RnfB
MDSIASFIRMVEPTVVLFSVLAVVFGLILALTARYFHVHVDPRIHQVTEVLAHAHCGACGYPGCEPYAEAVVKNPDVKPDLCIPGGARCAEEVARITGKVAEKREPGYARIMCKGGNSFARKSHAYDGIQDCNAAAALAGGLLACSFGCIGLGTCVKNCPFGAITLGPDSLPVVDRQKCTGCGVCAQSCPRSIIRILPVSVPVTVDCLSNDKGALTRKNCTAGCTGCGFCLKVCEHGAVTIVDHLSWIDPAKCIHCDKCLEKCPQNVISSEDKKG